MNSFLPNYMSVTLGLSWDFYIIIQHNNIVYNICKRKQKVLRQSL